MGADQFYLAVVGEEACGGDFGVVEDKQVAGLEIAGKISEHTVFNLAVVTVDDHHA